MKFISFIKDNMSRVGIYNRNMDYVYDINTLGLSEYYSDMNNLIKNINSEDLNILMHIYNEVGDKPEGYTLGEVTICAPIIEPRHEIICLGLNYKEHVGETSRGFKQNIELPKYPVYFSKRADRAVGPDGVINSHREVTHMLDYEVELAVIIGKEGINIAKEQAEDYIFGYTIMNDISARDLQTRHLQWFRGKSLDGFTAMGPYILHKSQLPLHFELGLCSRVNGELRQKSNTREFIFDIATIIHDLSQGITLKPGDIIATGTPSGVGMGFNPPRYLHSSDVVECEIEQLGVLRNTVKDIVNKT